MPRRNRRNARALTAPKPAEPPVHGILGKHYLQAIPRSEKERPYVGRGVDLVKIERAIVQANRGYMRPITDLSLETIAIDGHASALLQKRLNRLAALDWEVEPASGEDVDEQRAEDAAGMVRRQLELIPNFRQKITDIGWGVYHGRAASELQWYFNGREWSVTDLHWIHPRRLSLGPTRDLRVVDANNERGNFADVGFAIESIPYKFVVFKPRLFGEYTEREGLARRTLYWSFFARFGTRERMALLEIFGKPWRIISPKTGPDAPTPNRETLDEAFDAINSLGAMSTARLPVAMDVQIPQPATNAGQIHDQAIEYANKVLSKLYLGQTGTTDAVSTGLGSSIGDAHLSEEDLIIAADAWRVAEALEDQLTDAIVVVNNGPDAIRYAPKFRIRTDPPTDRKSEAELIKAAQEIGMVVSVEEARQRLGLRELREGEAPLVPPEPPAPLFSDSIAAPVQLEQDPSPPPPLLAPPASEPVEPVPDPAEALAAKMTADGVRRCEHGASNRCQKCGIERVRDYEIGADGEAEWKVGWRPIGGAIPTALVEPGADEADQLDALVAASRGCGATLFADPARSPATWYGSPDTLIERGVAEAAAVTGRLVEAIVAAVSGKSTARAVMAAARSAVRRFDLGVLEEAVERELLHGAMLGALDSAWEGDEDRPVQVESFADLWPSSILLAEVEPPFAGHPLEKALKSFLEKQVVTRPVFDRMSRLAKSRAFTVAGAMSDRVLATVQAELAAQVHKGAELRDFAKHAAARLESAGWTPINTSHVETVFRTNVQTAYSDGRFEQVTDPDVLAVRPYLQILTVQDSRRRPSHGRAHGWVFRTEDVNRTDLTPFGYNCRCRFRSLSERQVKGLPIRDPSELAGIGLPDPGFR